jgi:hypothetical protein
VFKHNNLDLRSDLRSYLNCFNAINDGNIPPCETELANTQTSLGASKQAKSIYRKPLSKIYQMNLLIAFVI